MYKVFIENRPIIFTEIIPTEINSFPGNVHLIMSENISDLKKDVYPLIHETTHEKQLVIFSTQIKSEFQRLFHDFDKIEAAGGIVKRKERILLIKRNGFWDIPKGKLEENELIEECAVREIEEECGIRSPEIVTQICTTYHTYDYHGKPTLKKTYWFALSYSGSKKSKPQTEEGITKIKWFKINNLDKIRKNTFSSINEVLDLFLNDEKSLS